MLLTKQPHTAIEQIQIRRSHLWNNAPHAVERDSAGYGQHFNHASWKFSRSRSDRPFLFRCDPIGSIIFDLLFLVKGSSSNVLCFAFLFWNGSLKMCSELAETRRVLWISGPLTPQKCWDAITFCSSLLSTTFRTKLRYPNKTFFNSLKKA